MKSKSILLAIACAALAPLASLAAELPHYKPEVAVSGPIRIWGSPDDAGLLADWDRGFREFQPGANLATSLHGSESALAGIYTGVADIAFVGRELRLPVDNMAFQWVKLYKPTVIEVANAGLSSQRIAAGLAIFVHRDNPIAGLTMQQLDGIFGAEHKRSAANIRTWGDLGVGGAWHDTPIHVVTPPVESIPALFFRRTVLGDSFKWNEKLSEFPSAKEAIAALEHDPSAVAFAPMVAATSAVRAVPIAARMGDPFVALSPRSASDRSYPLSRTVIVAIDHAPGKSLDPKVREFLRYVLSAEGQAAVARDGAYVVLEPRDALAQRKALE